MKNRIFNLIIIDESGSMQSIKREAIDSVNETIQTIRSAQKKYEDQEHFVMLVTFNDEVKTVYNCVPVNEVKELTGRPISPIVAQPFTMPWECRLISCASMLLKQTKCWLPL